MTEDRVPTPWPKPIRVHQGVLEALGRVDWGEPDEEGFYHPAIHHEEECPPCIDNGVAHHVGISPHVTSEKPEPSWNVELRGGPRDGILMHVNEETNAIVEGGVNGAPVIGAWVRTPDVSDGRIVFRWEKGDD